jgi:hypothetical protein
MGDNTTIDLPFPQVDCEPIFPLPSRCHDACLANPAVPRFTEGGTVGDYANAASHFQKGRGLTPPHLARRTGSIPHY